MIIFQEETDLSKVEINKVFLQDGGFDDNSLGFYCGPVEKGKDYCSDYYQLDDDWFEKILKQAGAIEYSIQAAENYHLIDNITEDGAYFIIENIREILTEMGINVIKLI